MICATPPFSIALGELRSARDHYADSRRQVGLRCFFLERDADAYARLKAYADAVDDAEVETRNAILEESVDAILNFVRREGHQTFRSFSSTNRLDRLRDGYDRASFERRTWRGADQPDD